MNVIEVSNLSFGYSKIPVLDDLSFGVESGSFLAIAGPNGAGKSTLLNLLCAVLKSKSGTIRIDGTPIGTYGPKTLAEKVAVVRQEFVPVFGFSVFDTVMMARTAYFGQMGFESRADRKIVNEALEATDTAQFSSRLLGNLSGGERQRVFIARALAQNTAILLLDEPTSFLDLKHQVGIYDLLKAAQLEKGKTIVAVTHDINLAAQYADVVLLLEARSNYHHGEAKEVFSTKQIEKVFGVRTFTGRVGREKFFLPLGRLAKDGQITRPNPSSEQPK